MSKGAVGAALGAGAATAYIKGPELAADWLQAALRSATGGPPGADAAQARLLEELLLEVRASRAAPPAGVTVVHAGGSAAPRSAAFYAAVGAAAAAALALGAARGWRLSDLAYVTQRSFRAGVAAVAAGLDALARRVADLRARLEAGLEALAARQAELAAAQAGARAELAGVAADVAAARARLGQVHRAVSELDAAVADVALNQRCALAGIVVLCRAVAELSAGAELASRAELLAFVESPAWQRARPREGLEALLRGGAERPAFFLGGGGGGGALLKAGPGDAEGRGGAASPAGPAPAAGAAGW
jgi:hypothetical protein